MNIPTGKKVEYALFDPDNQIMKSVSFNKNFDMLKAQALKAKSMLDRYDAIVAMEPIDIERKRDFLIAYFNAKDKPVFYGIKAEIIKQISRDDSKLSRDLLRQALADPDVQVRKAVINNFNLLPEELLPNVEKLLKDQGFL